MTMSGHNGDLTGQKLHSLVMLTGQVMLRQSHLFIHSLFNRCQEGSGFQLQFRIKNYSAFQTAEVFCLAKGIHPIRFSCHSFVTEHLSLLAYNFQSYCFTDVQRYSNVISFAFTTQKSTTKTPKQNCSLDCQVVGYLHFRKCKWL